MATIRHKTRFTGRFYTVCAVMCICLMGGALSGNAASMQVGCFLAAFLTWCYILSRRNVQDLKIVRKSASRAFARESFTVKVEIHRETPSRPVMCLDYADQLFGNGVFYAGELASHAVQPDRPEPVQVACLEGGSQSVTQMCTLRHRGRYSEFACRVTSVYPFGLYEQVFPVQVHHQDITVYPYPEQPPELQQLFPVGMGIGTDSWHNRRDSIGEFKGLRDFTSGDPVKLIHWPLSTRYQHLVVKEFDPVVPEEIMIIFHSFWSDPKTRMPSPEYALQILTGMFITLHNRGTEFTYYPSYDNWNEIRVTDDPETLEEALENLARAVISPLPTLTSLVDRLETLPEDDRHVVVFSNSPRSHWQELLGTDNALICLDCKLDLDLERLSQSSRRRRLEGISQ